MTKDWEDRTVKRYDPKDLSISQEGIDLLKYFEGFRSEAYLDPVGIPTLGYGFIKGVKMGDTITKEEAEERLKEELAEYEGYVREYVEVPLTQYQFDALVSFTYNLGPSNLKSSTVLRQTNLKNYNQATDAFMMWNKATKNGKLVVLPGLTRRRGAESAMFNGQDWREFL